MPSNSQSGIPRLPCSDRPPLCCTRHSVQSSKPHRHPPDVHRFFCQRLRLLWDHQSYSYMVYSSRPSVLPHIHRWALPPAFHLSYRYMLYCRHQHQCRVKRVGVFGDLFADPLLSMPDSAVLSGLQPGAYSWHLHILIVDASLNEKHACVLLPDYCDDP